MADPDAAEAVWHGPESLRGLLVPIDQMHEDPSNNHIHPERSIAGIAASYARFGQQKGVVADSKGVVRAGNGQLVAARRLGWTHLAVVRSNLAGSELTAYSIADNRLPAFAHFDDQALSATLEALRAEDIPLEAVGFTDAEVDELLKSIGADGEAVAEDDGGDRSEVVPERFEIIVTCRDEAQQRALYGRLTGEGLACRVLTI